MASGTSAASTSRHPGPLFEPLSDIDDDSGRSMRQAAAHATTSVRPADGVGDATMQGEEADSDPESDPDDPVIHTVPVFLTPALTDSLALLQYPHRPPALHTHHPLLPPSLRPEHGESGERPKSHRVTARYKPKVGQLELSIPLEVEAGRKEKRHNDDRAQRLGRGIQITDLGENGTVKSARALNGRVKKDSLLAYEEGNDTPLERISLSGETIPDQTWYACAVVKDSECEATFAVVAIRLSLYTRRGPPHAFDSHNADES